MNILIISSNLVFKGTRFGGSKRVYYLAKALMRKHAVSLICLDGSREQERFVQNEHEFERFLFILDPVRPPGGVLKLWRAPVDFSHIVRHNLETIRRFFDGGHFDAVLGVYPGALAFLDRGLLGPAARLFYMEDDLTIELYKHQARNSRNPFQKAWKYFRGLQLARYYRRQLRQIDAWVSISQQETDIIKGYFPWLKVARFGYGIPLSEYPFIAGKPARPCLGFIGNYAHPPNRQAVMHFVDNWWPSLVSARPDIEVIFAGENMPAELRERLSNIPGVMLLDRVEGLDRFYYKITVFVNPVVSGRGLRTKLVESAAFGRPVISTPLGAEGLEDLSIEIASTPQAFSRAAHRLISDDDYYKQVALRNRKQVEAEYCIENQSQEFLSALL